MIVPANAAKPVGPYSPGILAGGYLYVSGQGVRDGNGAMPDGIEAQTRQCLENVRAIIEAAGLTMAHVVHMQLYLEKMSDLEAVDRLYATYFPQAPPARVVVGVAKMPTDTTIEMTAVAVRDLRAKRVLPLASLKPVGHASPAVAVGRRVYVSGVYDQTLAAATRNARKALAEAKLGEVTILSRHEYSLTSSMIPVNELPLSMRAAVSLIASRGADVKGDAGNSSGACVADAETIFCSVQTSAGSGEKSVEGQVRAVLKKLQARLGAHGANLSHVVASNVYLDDIRQFKQMNEAYGSFFANFPPTRTTVQPYPPAADRGRNETALVRVSVIAVK